MCVLNNMQIITSALQGTSKEYLEYFQNGSSQSGSTAPNFLPVLFSCLQFLLQQLAAKVFQTTRHKDTSYLFQLLMCFATSEPGVQSTCISDTIQPYKPVSSLCQLCHTLSEGEPHNDIAVTGNVILRKTNTQTAINCLYNFKSPMTAHTIAGRMYSRNRLKSLQMEAIKKW